MLFTSFDRALSGMLLTTLGNIPVVLVLAETDVPAGALASADVYEVVLSNDGSAIRRGTAGPAVQTPTVPFQPNNGLVHTPDALAPSSARLFWVSWDSAGRVAAGHGHVPGQDEIMSYSPSDPLHPAFAGVRGNTSLTACPIATADYVPPVPSEQELGAFFFD